MKEERKSRWSLTKQRVLDSLDSVGLDQIYPSVDRQYYNEVSEFLSVDIAALFKECFPRKEYWYDDTLITRLFQNDEYFYVWGVAILGLKNGSTEQVTTPFYLQIDMSSNTINCFLGDSENTPLTYRAFANQRGYWDHDYFCTTSWDASQRKWSYETSI